VIDRSAYFNDRRPHQGIDQQVPSRPEGTAGTILVGTRMPRLDQRDCAVHRRHVHRQCIQFLPKLPLLLAPLVESVPTPTSTAADIRMTKIVDNATPTIGQNVMFDVRAINDGPGVATGITVQDLLPTGYTFVSKTEYNGSYEATGVWTVGDLNLNQTAVLLVTATVKTTGTYTNTATRTASTPTDPQTDNDSVSVVVTPN
jgi:uncharacterized repeat protein (TIGR01451 family)